MRGGGRNEGYNLVHLGSGGPMGLGAARAENGTKERLVSVLLALLTGETYRADRGAGGSQPPFSLQYDGLGRPRVLVRGAAGPGVSFSYAAGMVWAAVAAGSGVGVDLALAEEFRGPYPYPRAFGKRELEQVEAIRGLNLAERAALLWSLKEAAVKAEGSGFHRFDPLEVKVDFLGRQGGWLAFGVKAGKLLPAWARWEREGWLALSRLG